MHGFKSAILAVNIILYSLPTNLVTNLKTLISSNSAELSESSTIQMDIYR